MVFWMNPEAMYLEALQCTYEAVELGWDTFRFNDSFTTKTKIQEFPEIYRVTQTET